MDCEQIVKLVVQAGEIMLKNGAEIHRVDDTLKRMLKTFELTYAEAFVNVYAIIITIENKEKNTGLISCTKSIKTRTNNLEKIALVNQFSRDLVSDKIPLSEAFSILDEIENKKPYDKNLVLFAFAVSAFCFCFMLKGTIFDATVSFFVVLLNSIIRRFFYSKDVSPLILDIVYGFTTAFTSLVFLYFFKSLNLDIIVTSSITPYLPGLLLTNGIRDIFAEDILSGLSRLTSAILVATCLAIGVATMFKLFFLFGVVIN